MHIGAEYIFLLAGLILLMIELFLIPGFGFVGFAGLLCLALGAILAFLPEAPPEEQFKRVLIGLGGVAALSLALGLWLGPRLRKLPLFRETTLETSLKGGAEVLRETVAAEAGLHPNEERDLRAYLGATLKTVTVLRPGGKALAPDGRTLDVVSHGPAVAKGADVRVVDVNGPSVVVAEEQG